ncbi:MAG: hypothetical protein HYT80_01740 [Euryarchaeota archaeon]|nr:hypothetical protein [Euryarchaeota archaeon]
MAENVGASWVRWAGVAGLGMLALVVVFGIGGSLAVGAGDPPSGTTEAATLREYFGHAALGPLSAWAPFGAILGLLFFFGAREAWGKNPTGHRACTMALVLFATATPAFLVEGALVPAMVEAVERGGDIGTWFRFYDVLYNSYLDIIMGGAVLFLSWALWAAEPRRTWQARAGFVVAGLHAAIAITPWFALPSAVRAVAMLLFSVWFGSVCVALIRLPSGNPNGIVTPSGVPRARA